jgi:protein-S-isoprenylcysteine O-methyltransferase Ste14
MTKKTGKELLQEKLPITKKPRKFILIGFLQLCFFIILLLILYKIAEYNWKLTIMGQIIVSFFAILPYGYVTLKSNEIRIKYRTKFNNLAFQHVWFRFLSYNEPLVAASLFFPIFLKTDYFLPSFITSPSNIFTNTLLPIYVAIPIGATLIILGILMRRPTGGYDLDIGSYMYLIFPENSRKLNGGLYSFIRHPNYSGRGLVAFGIGILANNILAIILELIHFIWFYILSKIEDRELINRFGEDFIKFKKTVPAMIPKPKHLKAFFKIVLLGEKQ